MHTYTIIERGDEHSTAISGEIRKVLTSAGLKEDKGVPDTVFVVGGDGTFLYAVHEYLPDLDRVRFYGIHTGTLGFYSDYEEKELELFLSAYLDGKTSEHQYPLLEIDTGEGTGYALNEIRVENPTKTQVMDVYLNGVFFETFRGTGLSVSTQLGSTAYNRSLGGAVIEDGLDVIQLCEVAGIHHIKYRSLGSPIVLKGTTEIEFRSDSFDKAIIGLDSDVWPLEGERSLKIRVSERKVRLLKNRDVSYFQRLKILF